MKASEVMTIEEAIQHAEDVARCKCNACGDEHQQLADWLNELVVLRNVLKAKDAEIMKLRGCLKEAFEEKCSGTIPCDNCWGHHYCQFKQWRKALEGVNND